MWKNGAVIPFDEWKERGLKQNNFLQWYAMILICTEKYVQTEKPKSSEKIDVIMIDKNFLSLQTCNSKTIYKHVTQKQFITILEILKFQWKIGILKYRFI